MRYWIYVEPASQKCVEPVWTIMSDTAVLAQYYDFWSAKMIDANKAGQISDENCIQDWVSIHWAVEATKTNLLRIIGE